MGRAVMSCFIQGCSLAKIIPCHCLFVFATVKGQRCPQVAELHLMNLKYYFRGSCGIDLDRALAKEYIQVGGHEAFK